MASINTTHTLAAAATANGNYPSSSGISGGWTGLLTISGTFDGATAKGQLLPAGGSTWIDIADASFTADGAVIVALPKGATLSTTKFRVNVASAGASTDLRIQVDL